MASRLPTASNASPGKSVGKLLADNPPQRADAEWQSINAQWQPLSPGSPDRTVKQICWYWYHDQCRKTATECKFAHELRHTWPIQVPPGVNVDNHPKCLRPLCPLNADHVAWAKSKGLGPKSGGRGESAYAGPAQPTAARRRRFAYEGEEELDEGEGEGETEYDDGGDEDEEEAGPYRSDDEFLDEFASETSFGAKDISPMRPRPPRLGDSVKIPVSKPRLGGDEEGEAAAEGERAVYKPPRDMYITKRSGSARPEEEEECEGGRPREKIKLPFRRLGGSGGS